LRTRWEIFSRPTRLRGAGIGSAPSSKETMTHPPNSYCRVTFYVASVQSLELAKPQRLNTGEIEATWTHNRHRRPHQLDRRPGHRLATSLGSPILSQ
jgi:hypothetical protein